MKIRFVYVRHGKTLFNTVSRMQGSCDSPLTHHGIVSAQDTASALCHLKIDRAFCSSAERARDTAEILLQERNMKAVPMKGLKEFSYGDYDGKLVAELQDRLDEVTFSDDWSDAGGENHETFGKRAAQAFERIVSESKDGETVLIVGHGTYFMQLMVTLLHYDREEYIDRKMREGKPLMPNCGIAFFEYEDGVFRLTQEPVSAQEYRALCEPKHVTFLYVRHGETVFNTLNRMQGRCDSPLTQNGIDQARKAAERLKDRKIDRAYVSTAERTIDTAEILLEPHGITAIPDKRLREVSYGTYEAVVQSGDLAEEIFRRHETEEWSDVGGENMKQVWSRIESMLYYAADHAEDGDTVLLVSHGNLYLNMVEYFGKNRGELFKEAFAEGRKPMPNCGVFEFEYNSSRGFSVIHYMN